MGAVRRAVGPHAARAAGLAGACTIQTAKVLQEATEDKSQPPEVTQAARKYLARVRKQLFGNPEKES